MKSKVVITHWVHDEVIAYLEDYCIPVVNDSKHSLPRKELLAKARDATGMMVFMPDCIDADFLNACPSLRVVAAALKGYDNFDVSACSKRGIWFTIIPDLLTVPTAELAIALMMGLARNVLPGDKLIRMRQFIGWRPTLYGMGIGGSTVGILGMGEVGRAVARRLRGFDAKVIYYDKSPLTTTEELVLGTERKTLEQLLRVSDFLLIALPLTKQTYHLIDSSRIRLMKTGAYIVNVGRGSVVDEQAVAVALEQNEIAGYAADVFEFEDWALPSRPRVIPPALLNHPQCTLFTPHLGSAVDRVRSEIAMAAARNIVQALQGEIPRDAINRPLETAAALS